MVNLEDLQVCFNFNVIILGSVLNNVNSVLSNIIEVMEVFYIMLLLFSVDGLDNYIVDMLCDSFVDWVDDDDNM